MSSGETSNATTGRRVLISGASIAGPALAYWLNQYGWQTTVIERAPRLRDGGQNVDVRGAARSVVRRMHLEPDILDKGTGEQGTQFVDTSGAVKAEFPAGDSDTDGATAEMEILRGELAGLLHGRTHRNSDYLFGDQITAIQEHQDRVTVSFEHAEDQDFDVLVIAEGMNSSTRALVFNDVDLRPLGMYTAYLSIPRTTNDTRWARWYNATRGRAITLRPDNVGRTRAALSFLSGSKGYEHLNPAEQRHVLLDVFGDAGWQADRILAELADSDDLYFEYIGQIKAPHWSRGRVVLVGDAGYCASPISGMGTSLALVGAYILAGELAAHTHHRDAAERYEQLMRPYVEQAQKLPPGAPRIANPTTAVGIDLFHAALKIASAAPLGRIGSKLFSPPADNIRLADYSHLIP